MDSLALAQPIALGNVTLRNRIVMAPINTNYGDERGYVTHKSLSFYEERARGGAGALIVEPADINPGGRMFVRQLAVYDDSYIPGLAEIASRVHSHGALLFAQLAHAGPKTLSPSADFQPPSASDVPIKVGSPTRPMTHQEIAQTVEDFANAAARMREAGFDGVEIHAAHFYLLSAFLSAYLNRRTDEYGGSVENRARIVVQVVQAVKARAGADYPVLCRINGSEKLPERGIDEAEAQQIARLLEVAGADCIHVSAEVTDVNPKIAHLYTIRVGATPEKDSPPACFSQYAAAVKRVVGVPVIAVGKLNDPAVAERVLREGMADMVAIGRGLIADPYLPEKALQGRWSDIVPCDECRSCQTTLRQQRDMNCAANPKPWRPKQ